MPGSTATEIRETVDMDFLFPAIVFLALFTSGCQQSPLGLATVKMSIGQRAYTLEVANTQASEEHGLMERDSMPENHGMIFVFSNERVLEFWMKNTRFPLDILFVDSDGKVVSIKRMEAYDLHTTSSVFPAKYAIELNAGQAQLSGIKVGDQLSIPAAAKDSREAP